MNNTTIFLKMIFDRWNGALKNFNTVLDGLSDEQLSHEVAPGKNTGTYLLGHMIAVHDDMLILLDMGDKLYPELHEPFLKQPDKSFSEYTAAGELRNYWANQCAVMQQKFEELEPEGWFEKHTAVNEADFATEPHRNKLNIILTRTTHMSYHTGQLRLLQ